MPSEKNLSKVANKYSPLDYSGLSLPYFRYSNNRDHRSYKFQKFLTTGRRRPDFGVHKWDFGTQKRRFEMTKRRFCFDTSESL